MGAHSDKEEKSDGDLTWGDWAFVFALTTVAAAGAYSFVVYLFDRLW